MFVPMHRNSSFAGGLALGLVLLAAWASAAEYSGASLPGLPQLDAARPFSGKIRTAENERASSGGDAAKEEARKRLKNAKQEKAETKTAAPKPAKKPAPQGADITPTQPQQQPVAAIDPDVSRAAGRLIILRFSGVEPSDSGPKAIRALIHDRLIAGVLFGGDNIQSRSQIKELTKFFAQAGAEAKPLLAVSEIGGAGGAFPRINDFEAWPSERDVASKGDPQYAYLTYRSMAAFLAGLGFTLNFGPALGMEQAAREPSASFGESPLQAGVFAKTFILGHNEDDIVTVPVVDGSDAAVRAMKTLLVSYPVMPLAVTVTSGVQPFTAYEGLVRGPRFCFVSLKAGSDPAEAASPFSQGCDAIVADGGKESPEVLRELIVRGISDAIKNGSLTLASLQASVQKLSALRSPSSQAAFTTRTAQ